MMTELGGNQIIKIMKKYVFIVFTVLLTLLVFGFWVDYKLYKEWTELYNSDMSYFLWSDLHFSGNLPNTIIKE